MSKKLVSGMIWSFTEVAIKRSLDFIVKLILARILFPEDFGILGMATVFTSFIIVLSDAGMGPAVIQSSKLSNKLLNTVFWTNIVWALILFTLMKFAIAPIAAKFYNTPILLQVLPILCLSLFSGSLYSVHFSILRREMSFKKIAIIRNTSSVVAGITAILLALNNFGVWALVANIVIAEYFAIPLYYKAIKWKPRLQWDKDILKEILSFGLFLTGTKLLASIIGNADYIILGKWVSTSAIGAYTIAYMLTKMVSGQISSMVDTVMYPFYCKIKGNNNMKRSYYTKLVKYNAIIIYPIMLTLILFADILIPFLFGNKWIQSITVVRILSLSVMISTLTTGYNLLFRSEGNSKLEFKIQQITLVFIHLPCIFFGIYFYGLIGAAFGALLSSSINLFIHQLILKRVFNISFLQIIYDTKPISLLTILSLISYGALRTLPINKYLLLTAFACTTAIFLFIITKNELIPYKRMKSNQLTNQNHE